MNSPKAHVWKLVNSLSPAEKRYFKTHFASTNNRLTTLFDLLNKADAYDENGVRTALAVPPNQFKVLKHQLQELLLKSLIANTGKRNAKSKIRLGLEEADILLEREHYREATKKLQRLELLCAKYGLTLYQYEVLERLHEIQHLELDFSDPEAGQHYEELVHLQGIMYQKQRLTAIQKQLEDWNPFTPKRHRKLQNIHQTLYHFPAEFLDRGSLLAWMQNMAVCTELLGDEKTATQYRELILEGFNLEPGWKEEMPLSYLQALRHAASSTRQLPSISYVNEIAQRARRLIARHPQYSPHYLYFLWARLQVYYLHQEWDKITGLLESDCIKHLERYTFGLSRTTLRIYVTLAVVRLIKGDYERAEKYLEAYRNSTMSKDPSLERSVNLVELILLTDSQQLEKMEKRLRYFKRRLRKRPEEIYSPLYHFHLKLFSNILKRPLEKGQLTSNALLGVADYAFDPILYYYSFFYIERWLQATAAKMSWRATFVKG
mgnify:CR=1 FL=1